MIDLRLRQDLNNTSGLLEQHSMVAVDHVSLSRIGGYHDQRDFHVGRVLPGSLLVAFQDIVNWRRLAEQVEIGVEGGSQRKF